MRRDLERCRELSISRTSPDTPHVVELAVRDITEDEAARARPPEVDAYLERWQEREGVRLTAGQKAEVHLELTGSRGVALTIGDPGTAKTSTLEIVERFNEEVLRPEGREHLSVNLSYTGKAARELSLATGRPLTLNSFENGNPASKFALQRANREPPMLMVAVKRFSSQRGGKHR
ncbi:hypothetical protein KP004_05590 [Geomonas oryzisoli]|uniref:Uncharacterized protein n=1 Tax=Geomonas oryzisoli TaxID=2847992 RepID=A0ABX8J883_9BACT|nr:hypothetical protein [Geomonas oryzisoli]QWV94654.1 hypothetical protein KP004_05590 [Geomonas oryzisoli]